LSEAVVSEALHMGGRKKKSYLGDAKAGIEVWLKFTRIAELIADRKVCDSTQNLYQVPGALMV
jgi:hypothetical protein